MSFKILDDGLCYEKDIPTISDAMKSAEDFLSDIPFGEIGTIEIVNEITDETEFTFNPIINWE